MSEETKTIRLAAELAMEFKAHRNDNGRIQIDEAELVDSVGVRYRAHAYGQNPTGRLTCHIRAGSKEQLLSALEYG
jgi:hypothetical protein